MNFIRHFDQAHNADLSDWIPWYQDHALLGWMAPTFAERGVALALFQHTATGLQLIPSETHTYDQRFAEFAEIVYAEGLLRSWVGELFPVKASVEEPPRFVMERTLTAPLGCLTFGVHLNGYVRTAAGLELWVATRAHDKPTFPGMLDNMVGGGQPAGIGLKENLVKECFEEAGIGSALAQTAIPTGTISYCHSDGRGLKRDVLYCFDLELPEDFVPVCQDGEVASFQRMPIDAVLEIVGTTDQFKYNCNLVIIDFAIRHGFLNGDNTPDYTALSERRHQLVL
jgi:8-oxo-dGTP pyrophosphatase MutT (NUDIX family)